MFVKKPAMPAATLAARAGSGRLPSLGMCAAPTRSFLGGGAAAAAGGAAPPGGAGGCLWPAGGSMTL